MYKIGRATVTRVNDMDLSHFTPATLLPGWDPGILAEHPGWAAAETMDAAREHILMSIHTWVVQDGDRTILVDTGAGNDKDRPYASYFHQLQTPFLERLRAMGVEPEDVDYVLHTHLHVDHVGWNTRLQGGQWVPTFPNARYIFSRAEHDYFTDPKNHTERNRTSFMVQRDSVDPVIAAGLAQMIEIDGSEPIEGFAFHPTPGHTIDHASIAFRSQGQTALFAGDVLHHPLQVFRPDLISVFDAFADETRRSRAWALNFAVDHQAMFFSSHFTGTSAGRVTRRDSAFAWQFA